MLIIEDTGIGIRPEDVSRVFEKGYTGYNGRLDKRASGIGLYLAKKVADALGIKIQLTSKVGTGTKVVLLFPEQKDFRE
jgi:signal transduction histidine kinase